MGAIESRLARLEQAQQAENAPRCVLVEIRPVGDDLWRDPDGRTGTKAELTALQPNGSILVFLSGGEHDTTDAE